MQKEAWLLELARHIVLNPVRAQMARSARDWRWSSYRATAGHSENDPWLTTQTILGALARTRTTAQKRYRDFVQAGKGQPSPWQHLKNQIYLGDDGFIEDMRRKLAPGQSRKGMPKKQRQAPARPLDYFATRHDTLDEAMAQAYLSGHYTLAQVGEYFGVSYATVSRAVKWAEESGRGRQVSGGWLQGAIRN